jgi:hypothetical protein
MAKYGWFDGAGKIPIQEFEGDYMTQDGDYVKIFKSNPSPKADEQLGAVKLDKTQSVRKIG